MVLASSLGRLRRANNVVRCSGQVLAFAGETTRVAVMIRKLFGNSRLCARRPQALRGGLRAGAERADWRWIVMLMTQPIIRILDKVSLRSLKFEGVCLPAISAAATGCRQTPYASFLRRCRRAVSDRQVEGISDPTGCHLMATATVRTSETESSSLKMTSTSPQITGCLFNLQPAALAGDALRVTRACRTLS
jgi:hypothetical protein